MVLFELEDQIDLEHTCKLQEDEGCVLVVVASLVAAVFPQVNKIGTDSLNLNFGIHVSMILWSGGGGEAQSCRC